MLYHTTVALHEWKIDWESQAFCLEITDLVIR